MKKFGILLVIFGAGSFALNMVGYEFSLLMWIDTWGVEVGWAIRGAMIVVGGLLFFLGMKAEAGEAGSEPLERQEPGFSAPVVWRLRSGACGRSTASRRAAQ